MQTASSSLCSGNRHSNLVISRYLHATSAVAPCSWVGSVWKQPCGPCQLRVEQGCDHLHPELEAPGIIQQATHPGPRTHPRPDSRTSQPGSCNHLGFLPRSGCGLERRLLETGGWCLSSIILHSTPRVTDRAFLLTSLPSLVGVLFICLLHFVLSKGPTL